MFLHNVCISSVPVECVRVSAEEPLYIFKKI